MNELQIYKNLLNKAESLAKRWIKAWGNSGYNGVGGVSIDLYNKKICFSALPMSSGMPWVKSIDMKYLENDSTLEVDSLAWYTNYHSDRTAKHIKMQELANSPDVKEFLALKTEMEGPWGISQYQ